MQPGVSRESMRRRGVSWRLIMFSEILRGLSDLRSAASWHPKLWLVHMLTVYHAERVAAGLSTGLAGRGRRGVERGEAVAGGAV